MLGLLGGRVDKDVYTVDDTVTVLVGVSHGRHGEVLHVAAPVPVPDIPRVHLPYLGPPDPTPTQDPPVEGRSHGSLGCPVSPLGQIQSYKSQNQERQEEGRVFLCPRDTPGVTDGRNVVSSRNLSLSKPSFSRTRG